MSSARPHSHPPGMMNEFLDQPSNASMPASTVIPVLAYPDVPAAASWLCSAFGFAERLRIGSHRIQLSVGGGAIVAAQAPRGRAIPASAGQSVMVRVASADRHFKSAVGAGAHILSEPTTQPYGERQYSAQDPWGYVWVFSETVANVEPSLWGGELIAKNVA